MNEPFICSNRDQLAQCFRYAADQVAEGVIKVTVQAFNGRRTLSANALYWVWLDEMAKHFTTAKGEFTKDDMHDLMRHKFLGYTEPRKLGKTEIGPELRSTARLSKGEMCEYMTQIDAWAIDHGVFLSRPQDSEYSQWAEAA